MAALWLHLIWLKLMIFNLPHTALIYLQAFAPLLPSSCSHTGLFSLPSVPQVQVLPPHPKFLTQSICKQGPRLLASSPNLPPLAYSLYSFISPALFQGTQDLRRTSKSTWEWRWGRGWH